MGAPQGIAKFDSATAMLLALSHFLQGKDFAGLGQPPLLQMIVRRADWVPRHWREKIFAHLGASEAVAPEDVDQVSTEGVARWMVEHYPQRRYPGLMIGSSNGALLHVATALGIPWLPQTFLTLVKQTHVHPDDPTHAMETEQEAGERFLAANPDSQLHHLHDPSQDRLMLRLITYYRSKYRCLPPAYRDFILRSVPPGGTLYVVECGQRWPVTRLGERYVYQFGAVGGPTAEEYFEGGERVADYLEQEDSPVRRWRPPAPNEEGPEAEWGFEASLLDDIAAFARENGYRLVRLRFEDPEDTSALVADMHRDWLVERGIEANRLVVESFVMMEPYWTLLTGSVPYWIVFNMKPSLERLERYLSAGKSYDEIYLTLFAHGVDSVGLPPIDEWRTLLGRARQKGAFLGIDPDAYPAHFAAFGRYSQEIRKLQPHHPLPDPLPLARVEAYIAQQGRRHGVHLEAAE